MLVKLYPAHAVIQTMVQPLRLKLPCKLQLLQPWKPQRMQGWMMEWG
jgi:hypothetical protein